MHYRHNREIAIPTNIENKMKFEYWGHRNG